MKFTALASRASRTSINYTRVFNKWRSFAEDVFSSRFWSSGSSDDCHVNHLKQRIKLVVLASRASGTSENYLRAFNRWAEFAAFPLFLAVPWIVPSTCSCFYSHQSRRRPSTALFRLSGGCIRLQERILLPYSPPLSPRRRELCVLLSNRPLIGKNPSR